MSDEVLDKLEMLLSVDCCDHFPAYDIVKAHILSQEKRIAELQAAIRDHKENWFEGMCWEEANKRLMEVLGDE